MQSTVRLVAKHRVRIGAHPGYPNLQGFGRREMGLTPDEVEALVLFQVSAMQGFARAEGVEVAQVKPHGALYNRAAREFELAEAISRAIWRLDREIILVGLAGSLLI
jgi:5-oxoprolinase (ATP-hydrolysing) subunit A